MAGYSGYSMSNNAVDAYESGEKPRSKWTKAAILNAIEAEVLNGTLSLQCNIEKLKQAPLSFLRTKVLQYASWHHTSKYFNRTDFYSLDTDYLASLTDKRINEDVERCRKEQSQAKNHRTVPEIFHRADGSRKKVSANGFQRIKRLDETEDESI